jgi:hypothetical protein
MTNKILWAVAVVSLIVSGYSLYLSLASSPAAPSFGSVGLKLVENYDPYVRYNGGTYTALPIRTTSTFSAATSTFSQQFNLTNPTFCVNFYATSTATILKMVASTTPTLPNGAAAVFTAQYGSCAN